MTQTWVDSFPDLSEWTVEQNNGTITPPGSTVEMEYTGDDDCRWDADSKLPVRLRIAFADLGFDTVDTYLVFQATVTPADSAGVSRSGIAIWESDTDAYRLGSIAYGAGVYGAVESQGISDTWNEGINATLTTGPLLVRIDLNLSSAEVVSDHGVTIPAGSMASTVSRDGGSTWTTVFGYGAPGGVHACGVTPTEFCLCTYQALWVGYEGYPMATAFSGVSVTAPLLPLSPAPPVDSTADKIRRILMDLYPPGAYPSWEDRAGEATFHFDICDMDASILADAQDAIEQLELEIFPQTADECLDEWEAALEIDVFASATADRQTLCRNAASSPRPITPSNLRALLGDLLSPTYGFWDHGTADVLAHYDVQQGNGSVAEDEDGLALGSTSPAECSFDLGDDPHVTSRLVDRSDGWTLEAELQSATIGAGTATGIFISPEPLGRLGDAIFLGLEHYGGSTAIRAMLYDAAAGHWGELGTIATVGPPCWFRIVHGRDGVLQLRAGASLSALADVAADIEVTWTPRVWGVCTRNSGAWATVEGVWQDIRIAYDLQRNNVELHEYRADQVPADDPERIFWAFIHRDPSDGGSYDIAGAQRISDRVKWGHTQIIVGESDCFRCEDPYSLTDRDILGA